MKDNKIDNEELARDLAYHCLNMIKLIYHLDGAKDCDLEDEVYHKVKTSIKCVLKDIEEKFAIGRSKEYD